MSALRTESFVLQAATSSTTSESGSRVSVEQVPDAHFGLPLA
jgi:hypothetical protein